MNFINYIIENKEEIIAVASSVVALASLVAALTPTPKDDSWVGNAYKIVAWLALNVGKAKDKPAE